MGLGEKRIRRNSKQFREMDPDEKEAFQRKYKQERSRGRVVVFTLLPDIIESSQGTILIRDASGRRA